MKRWMQVFNPKNITYGLLLICLFFVPIFEGPKNWFFGLFVVSCFFLHKQEWISRRLIIDWLMLIWVILSVTSGLNAKYNYYLEFNFFDVFRFVALGWCVSKLPWIDEKRKTALIITLSISTLLALGQGYLECPQGGSCIELNSVGHVNHSAIYMVLVFSLVLSFVLFSQVRLKYIKLLLTLVSFVLALGIVYTQSRAAFLVMLALIALMGMIKLFYANKWQKLTVFLSLVAIVVIGLNNPPEVIKKIENGTAWVGESPRKKLRRFSYYIVKQYPILGIGFGNFSRMGFDDIKEAVINESGEFDQSHFLILSHPHNLYYNYLISGGIVLFSVLVLFFIYIFYIAWYLSRYKEYQWLVIASLAAVIVNLSIGLVNTTLHHEHAMLTMLVFGLLIGEYRKKIIENTD